MSSEDSNSEPDKNCEKVEVQGKNNDELQHSPQRAGAEKRIEEPWT